MYTEYKFTPEDLAAAVAEKSASVRENAGPDDLLGYGLGVVGRRLKANPLRYREYGPYWWALKRVMIDAEYNIGDEFDPVVAAEYAGSSPVETLVAAELFRDDYRATWPVGTNRFDLGEGIDYVLFDADMEARSAA